MLSRDRVNMASRVRDRVRFRVRWLGVAVNVAGRINEVNQHRARLVLGWVTVSGLANHLGV